jgi:hypothetical protein
MVVSQVTHAEVLHKHPPPSAFAVSLTVPVGHTLVHMPGVADP